MRFILRRGYLLGASYVGGVLLDHEQTPADDAPLAQLGSRDRWSSIVTQIWSQKDLTGGPKRVNAFDVALHVGQLHTDFHDPIVVHDLNRHLCRFVLPARL